MSGLSNHYKGRGQQRHRVIIHGLNPNAVAIDILKSRLEEEEKYAFPPKRIMIDGVWNVPPEERPKGWEKMGGKEK